MKSAKLLKQEIDDEIRSVPKELLPSLLSVVRNFRSELGLKSPEESLEQSVKEFKEGKTLPISQLWDGFEDIPLA